MFQSFVALGVVSVVWVFIGFSLAFGDSLYGIIGNPFKAYLSRLFMFSAASATAIQLAEKSTYLRGHSLKSLTNKKNSSRAETTCKVSVGETPVNTRAIPLKILEKGSTKLPLRDSCALIGARV